MSYLKELAEHIKANGGGPIHVQGDTLIMPIMSRLIYPNHVVVYKTSYHKQLYRVLVDDKEARIILWTIQVGEIDP